MNSLQLITKLKSKASDIAETTESFFAERSDISLIEKELLKKQTLEFFELVLKLKANEEIEKPKINFDFKEHETTNSITAKTEDKLTNEFVNEPTNQSEPVQELKSLLENEINQDEISLNMLEEIIEDTKIEEEVIKSVEPTEEFHEVVVEEKTTNYQTPEKIFNKVVEKAVENKRIGYTVLPPADAFKTAENKQETINDRLAKINQNQTIEPKIDSLKTAISLNKKIAFVNELFKENVVEYAKAIDRLNNADNLHEALNILAEYRQQYNWEGSNQLYIDLDTLIKRRFK
ncbi:MAG: hypothetical protein ACK4K9_09425 [Bacteroidia bacterium]